MHNSLNFSPIVKSDKMKIMEASQKKQNKEKNKSWDMVHTQFTCIHT